MSCLRSPWYIIWCLVPMVPKVFMVPKVTMIHMVSKAPKMNMVPNVPKVYIQCL